MKPTNEQCIDVSNICIAYLAEKCATERGLFRSSVSQTEVRILQAQLINMKNAKLREEPDPHVVSEVLLTSLRDMSFPLFHEVYNDFLENGMCAFRQVEPCTIHVWACWHRH